MNIVNRDLQCVETHNNVTSFSSREGQLLLHNYLVLSLPAGLRVAQPCRYCFYSQAQKWVFRPAGATRCPDKRLRSAPPCQLSRLSGQKCWNTAPKTVKISNFGQKFVPHGRLVCNIFTKFSAFLRIYR